MLKFPSEQSSTRKSGRLASKGEMVKTNMMQGNVIYFKDHTCIDMSYLVPTSGNFGKGKGKSKSKIVSKAIIEDSEDDGEVSARPGGSNKQKEKKRAKDRAMTRANKQKMNLADNDGDKGFLTNPLVMELQAKKKIEMEKEEKETEKEKLEDNEENENNVLDEKAKALLAEEAKSFEELRKEEEAAAKEMQAYTLEEEMLKKKLDMERQPVEGVDLIVKRAKKGCGVMDQSNALKRRRESSEGLWYISILYCSPNNPQ